MRQKPEPEDPSKREFISALGAGATGSLLSTAASGQETEQQSSGTTIQLAGEPIDVQPETNSLGFRAETDSRIESNGLMRYLATSSANSGVHKINVDDWKKEASNTSDFGDLIGGGLGASQNTVFAPNDRTESLKGLDDSNLNQSWNYQVTGAVKDVETLQNEVFVKDGTAESGSVFKLDTSGEVQWEESVGPSRWQTLAEMNGDVYIGTDSAVKALDGNNGDTKWSANGINQILEGGMAASKGLVAGRSEKKVYVGDDKGLQASVSVGDEDFRGIDVNGDFVYDASKSGFRRISKSGVEKEQSYNVQVTDIEASQDFVVVGRQGGIDVYNTTLSEKIATLDSGNSSLPQYIGPYNIEIHHNGDITFTGWDGESTENPKDIVYKANVEFSEPVLSVDSHNLEYSGIVGDELSMDVELSNASGDVEYELDVSGDNGETVSKTETGAVPTLETSTLDPDQQYQAVLTATDSDGEQDQVAETFNTRGLNIDNINHPDRASIETDSLTYSPELSGPDAEAVDEITYILDGETVGTGTTLSKSPPKLGIDQVGDHNLTVKFTVGNKSYQETVKTETTPPPVFREKLPRDLDGDGLYEAVRGEKELTILDIQTLFNNLDNPKVQENSEAYNFQGQNPDEVSILDVQGQFNKLENS